VITILARIMLNLEFITFKVKIGIKELGNDVYFKNIILYIVEIDEACRKRVSSLKTCRLQDQLVVGKFGASCKIFFQNIETHPVVLQYYYRLGFKMILF
jgi:hypothetical protein